jgi:hypothetical protein
MTPKHRRGIAVLVFETERLVPWPIYVDMAEESGSRVENGLEAGIDDFRLIGIRQGAIGAAEDGRSDFLEPIAQSATTNGVQ